MRNLQLYFVHESNRAGYLELPIEQVARVASDLMRAGVYTSVQIYDADVPLELYSKDATGRWRQVDYRARNVGGDKCEVQLLKQPGLVAF